MNAIRISTSQIFNKGSKGISNGQTNLYKLQNQLASGVKVNKPSDDPVASARSLLLKQTKSYTEQTIRNLNDIDGKLSEVDSQLSYLNNRLVAVRDLLIQAGNTDLTQVDREAIAKEINEIYGEVMGIANVQDANGNYLFSGYQGDVRPYSSTKTGATYYGDNGQQLIQASSGRQLVSNITGPEVFNFKDGNGTFSTDAGTAYYDANGAWQATFPPVSVISRYDSEAVLRPGTVNTANQKTAIEKGSQFEIKHDGNNFVMTSKTDPNVKYTGTIDNFKLTFKDNNNEIMSFLVDGTLKPTDVFDVDLSAKQNAGIGTINQGSVKNYAHYENMLNTSNGKYQQLAIKFSEYPKDDNPGEFETYYQIYDITDPTKPNELKPADPNYVGGKGVRFVENQEIIFNGLEDNGQKIDLGISVAILNGTPSGGDSFTIKTSETSDVFQTIKGIVNLLRGNDVQGNSLSGEGGFSNIEYSSRLSGFLQDLDQALQNNDRNRARVGSTLQEVDYLNNTSSDKIVQYTDSISKLVDLDYAQAISQLMLEQMALQAAISSFQQTSQMSLFNS